MVNESLNSDLETPPVSQLTHTQPLSHFLSFQFSLSLQTSSDRKPVSYREKHPFVGWIQLDYKEKNYLWTSKLGIIFW